MIPRPFLLILLLGALLKPASADPGPALRPRTTAVVFRIDDFSAKGSIGLDKKILEIFEKYRAPLTVGVVPFVCAGNQHALTVQQTLPLPAEKAALLTDGYRKGYLHVALHGYSHQTINPSIMGEFAGLQPAIQEKRIKAGKEFLERITSIPVTAFVPPWNRYDKHTLKVLEKCGFTHLSADRSGSYVSSTDISYVPCTVTGADFFNALEFARKLPADTSLIVYLFHFSDITATPRDWGMSLAQLDSLVRSVTSDATMRVVPMNQVPAAFGTMDIDHYKKAHVSFLLERILPRWFRSMNNWYFYRQNPGFVSLVTRLTVFYGTLTAFGVLIGLLIQSNLQACSRQAAILLLSISGAVAVIVSYYAAHDFRLSCKGTSLSVLAISFSSGLLIPLLKKRFRLFRLPPPLVSRLRSIGSPKKSVVTFSVWMFLWLVVTLSVFFSGHLYSNDSLTKIHSMRNFLGTGSFRVSSVRTWGHTGRDGIYYPQFSLGSILNTAPSVATFRFAEVVTGTKLPQELLGALVVYQNVLYTALIGVCMFLLMLVSGLPSFSAFLWSSAIVFGSQILPYSSTAWSEPGAFFFGATAFLLWTFFQRNGKSRIAWFAWSVAALAASLIRIEYVAFFLLFALVVTIRKKRMPAGIHYSGPAGIVLLIGHLGFNLYRFGSFSNTGYIDMSAGHSNRLSQIISSALSIETIGYAWSFLVSFGKVHWFWVSPLLVLVPLIFIHRKTVPDGIRSLFYASLLFMPLHILLIGTAKEACTSWCWGFRYFYTTFPFLLIPIGFIYPCFGRWRKALPILVGLSITMSIVPSLTNFHLVLEHDIARHGFDSVMWERIHVPWHAPFFDHFHLLLQQIGPTIDLALGRTLEPSWELLRTQCLDIWPVGFAAMGFDPRLGFLLWALNVVAAVGVGIIVLRSTFPGGETISQETNHL